MLAPLALSSRLCSMCALKYGDAHDLQLQASGKPVTASKAIPAKASSEAETASNAMAANKADTAEAASKVMAFSSDKASSKGVAASDATTAKASSKPVAASGANTAKAASKAVNSAKAAKASRKAVEASDATTAKASSKAVAAPFCDSLGEEGWEACPFNTETQGYRWRKGHPIKLGEGGSSAVYMYVLLLSVLLLHAFSCCACCFCMPFHAVLVASACLFMLCLLLFLSFFPCQLHLLRLLLCSSICSLHLGLCLLLLLCVCDPL